MENKILFFGNDLRIQTTIFEVVDGIYKDITLNDCFEFCQPTEEMIAEDIYDEWTNLATITMNYLEDDEEYKSFAKLVVMEKRVDVTNVYEFDCMKMDEWELIGTLRGYGNIPR